MEWTFTPRGSSRSTSFWMESPLPAASQPSKTTQTGIFASKAWRWSSRSRSRSSGKAFS
jgi:hypothetical protein